MGTEQKRQLEYGCLEVRVDGEQTSTTTFTLINFEKKDFRIHDHDQGMINSGSCDTMVATALNPWSCISEYPPVQLTGAIHLDCTTDALDQILNLLNHLLRNL